MPNQCIVDERKEIRAVAERLDHHPAVAAVDVIDPNTDPSGMFTLEVTLEIGTPLLPRLQRILADGGLSVMECEFRSKFDHRRVIARKF